MSKSADSLVATTSDGNSSDNATIRVRCPSAATESDFIVDAKLSSTVRELKERLSVDSPWRPRVADQRIIFVGKVLEDSLSLRDALAKVDTSLPQTVHLVVRGGGVSPVREPIHPKEAETSPPVDTPAADARVPTDPRPIDPPAEPSVEASPPSDTPNSAEALSGVPFLMHLQRLGVPYEIVVIGGMPYALHPHVPLFTLATAASPQSTPDFANLMRTILELPAAPPAAPPPVQPPPPANLQELLNNPFAAINAFLWGAGAPQAGGAREPGGAAQVPGGEDEFGENLAQQQQQQPIWLFLKLAFMSYMFSQGSDRYRFFTINAVAVLIFVVQTGIAGWLYRLVRGAPPALVANNNNGNVNVNANGNNDAQEGPQDRPAAQEGENPPNEGAAQEPTEEVPPPPPQPWYLELKDIAVSFITSLVPEQPNVI